MLAIATNYQEQDVDVPHILSRELCDVPPGFANNHMVLWDIFLKVICQTRSKLNIFIGNPDLGATGTDLMAILQYILITASLKDF